MQILVVHNGKNSRGHFNDAGGAFIPEAVLFTKHHTALGNSVERVPYDNTVIDHDRRADGFLQVIEHAKPFDALVYLGHGLRTSLSSAQIDASNRKLFIRLLAKKARDPKKLILTLYACSTGESPRKTQDGNNGFADLCRDDLEAAGFTSGHVDAHTIAAHATQNAYVRRFDIGPGSNIGGDWLISPESPEWPRWRARLHAKAADDAFRFDFPYLSRDEVAAACKEHG